MQPALGLFEFKLNTLVGLQGFPSGHFDCAKVNEDLTVLTIGDDESVTFGIREPFDST